MPKKITQNVNKDKIFNDLPKVNPGHSKWLTRWTNYQDSNLGEIVPVYWDEVLPNEKKQVTMGMISHTTTPVAPIFPSLYTEFRAFWVPMRLAADLLNGYKTRKSPWVKVFGEDNSNSNSNIIVPLANQTLPDVASPFAIALASSSSYLADRSVFNSLDLDVGSNPNSIRKFNFLNLAAYELIYQRHYRNENYEASTASPLYRLLFDAYNPSKSYSGITIPTFEISNREKDYFTGMKPFTLKASSPVSISLGTTALVKADDELHDMAGAIKLGPSAGSLLGGTALGVQSGGEKIGTSSSASGTYGGDITKSNLIADLSSVSGISIEELRLLIKTQELLEKDAIYGSIYASSLNAHFGCCPLDTTLQDPQELFKVTITSQMQAIFQTSTTSGESTILGTIGANSSTQTDPFVIVPETKFKEHGILMVCAVHKLQNVYDTKYWKPKFNLKKARFDFYTPELNDLGYQPITRDEMTTLVSGVNVAGYNEAFAEYRYKYNKLHGNLARSFQYWAPGIANEYSSAAALYKEDVAIFDKALSVTSSTAPQFYDAFGFEEVNEKPMSLHSIPGMDGVI